LYLIEQRLVLGYPVAFAAFPRPIHLPIPVKKFSGRAASPLPVNAPLDERKAARAFLRKYPDTEVRFPRHVTPTRLLPAQSRTCGDHKPVRDRRGARRRDARAFGRLGGGGRVPTPTLHLPRGRHSRLALRHRARTNQNLLH